MSNSLQLCSTHFSRGGEKFCSGGFAHPAPPGYGPGSDAYPSKSTGSPLHFWRSSKLEQLGYPSIFQLSNFCLWSRATGARKTTRESANQTFSSGNTGPQRRVARNRHGPPPQKWCDIFSICFKKCFRNKSESVSETNIKFFQNENVFI